MCRAWPCRIATTSNASKGGNCILGFSRDTKFSSKINPELGLQIIKMILLSDAFRPPTSPSKIHDLLEGKTNNADYNLLPYATKL